MSSQAVTEVMLLMNSFKFKFCEVDVLGVGILGVDVLGS